jgi:hypothetical protein
VEDDRVARSQGPFRHLFDFVEHWKDRDGFDSDGGSHCWFPVIVHYETGAKAATVASKVRIFRGSGPNDGRVEIEESGKLTVEDFRLGFKADYQDFRFDSRSGSLIVTGSSPKMGGPYSVTISPQL